MIKYKAFVLWIVSLMTVQVESQDKTDYKNVLDNIFTTNSYNKKVLPMPAANSPVIIDLSFHLLGINELDELKEKLVTTAYLSMSWIDSGLQFTSASFNNLDKVFIPQDDVWKPDIFLQNGFTKFKELGGSYYYLEVYYDGTVMWSPFEVFESRCSLDTTYYPFDEQTCNIIFVVWSHSVAEVEIFKSSYGIMYAQEFETNSVWDILSIKYEVSKESRESIITFSFHLKRKPLYYIVNIILPVIFLGLLNGLVFIIPADSGEKTGYSITVFLSLAVFLTIVSTLLPVSSEKVSILGIYLLLQIVFGVIVLLVTTLELRLNVRSSSVPVTGIYLKIVKLTSRKCCSCEKRNKTEVTSLPEKGSDEVIAVDETTYTWGDVVSSIDFIGFWSFVVSYLLLTLIIFLLLTVSSQSK